MKSLAEITAEYQSRVLIPAIALALVNEKPNLKQVFSPDELANLVERRFGVRPERISVVSAVREGVLFRIWRIHGQENPSPHVQILPGGLKTYIESLRYVLDSDLVALETVGTAHLVESLDRVKSQALADYEFNETIGRESRGDVGFDRLRDGLNFIYGNGEYRARGRSPFSRKIDKDVDWTKWGGIAAVAALPLAVLLWWFT